MRRISMNKVKNDLEVLSRIGSFNDKVVGGFLALLRIPGSADPSSRIRSFPAESRRHSGVRKAIFPG